MNNATRGINPRPVPDPVGIIYGSRADFKPVKERSTFPSIQVIDDQMVHVSPVVARDMNLDFIDYGGVNFIDRRLPLTAKIQVTWKIRNGGRHRVNIA